MQNNKDAALEYISRGWPVLALYSTTKAGCLCGNDNCKSPGKHPRADLNAHGVKDATLEPSVVVAWPDDINVGIALGYAGLMVFDVDEVNIAAQFLDPMSGLVDETGLVVTGRPGAHIYLICTGDVSTTIITSKKSGKSLGELRGKGAYVVAPPSRAVSGRHYKWLGRKPDDAPKLAQTKDAGAFVLRLLSSLGVEATTSRRAQQLDSSDLAGAVRPVLRLPKAINTHNEAIVIKQVLAGNVEPMHQNADRSKHIFRFGVSVQTAARERKYDMSVDILAGLIKQADIAYFDKYSGAVRDGSRTQEAADTEYRRIAVKVQAEQNGVAPVESLVEADAEEAALEAVDRGPDAPENVIDPHYFWDEDVGMLFYRRTANVQTPERLFNFVPRMLAEIRVDHGDEGEQEIRRKVMITLYDGRQQIVTLLPEDWESARGVAEAVARECPSEFIIFAPAGAAHIRAVLQVYSDMEHLTRYTVRAVPGWLLHGEERLYLLPGADGAIGADGVSGEVKADPKELQDSDPIMDTAYSAYGKGVRKPADSEKHMAWDAFENLITCGKLEITFTLALCIAAGPLFQAGVAEVPPLLHVTGKTGVLKTSYCLAALSMFGTFKKTTPPPASWHGTPNSIRLLLHNARDLTLLVDDYKEAGINKVGVNDLINSYADKSARRRATQNQKVRTPDQPRGLLMSNGEDRWEKEASNVARSVIIEIHNGDIDDRRLAVVQASIDRGELQLFGGAFLSWLAEHAQDDLFDNDGVSRRRERLHGALLKRFHGKEMHRRLMASASVLLAVGDVMRAWLKEWYPEKRPLLEVWLRELVDFFVAGAEQRAAEVEELSAFKKLTEYIGSQMLVSEVALRPEGGIDEGHYNIPENASRGEIIGWWSEHDGIKYAHLAESVTFTWYKRELRRAGDSVSFSWRSFLQEAKNGFGAEYKARRVWMDGSGKRVQKRVVTFRLDLLGIK